MKFKIYEGISKKATTKDNCFQSKEWISKEYKRAVTNYKDEKNYICLDNVIFYYLNFHKLKEIKVLDWGGAYGNLFFELKNINKNWI